MVKQIYICKCGFRLQIYMQQCPLNSSVDIIHACKIKYLKLKTIVIANASANPKHASEHTPEAAMCAIIPIFWRLVILSCQVCRFLCSAGVARLQAPRHGLANFRLAVRIILESWWLLGAVCTRALFPTQARGQLRNGVPLQDGT